MDSEKMTYNIQGKVDEKIATVLRNPDPLNDIEACTRINEPSLGSGDESRCLPGWIETFCEKHRTGEGYNMSAGAVSALAHTLIAARIRCHRLVAERDAALRQALSEQEPAATETGVERARDAQPLVVRPERDITFEQAMFEWYQKRSRELLADPNHEEFQVRYDEHSMVFNAILTIKNAMLREDRRAEVARMLIDSFSGE